MSVNWDDESTIELLKETWVEGLSCAQIAKLIPGATRSAIIGKVHRLGLEGRSRPSRPMTQRVPREQRPTKPAPKRAPSPKLDTAALPAPPSPPVRYVEEGPGLATVLTLDAHMCKWPIGDPRKATFTYCGRRRDEGPYCIEHARVAYQPIVKNGKRRPTGNELARSLRRFV